MAKLEWCRKQKSGIKFIEPNDNLAEEYISTAEETLATLKSIKNNSRVWLATTQYYCEYFAIYALLMKLGIQSEIHECTISVSSWLEKKKIVPIGYTERLSIHKVLRIDNQYYLKNREVIIDYDKLLNFILDIKNIINTMKNSDIRKIREELMKK